MLIGCAYACTEVKRGQSGENLSNPEKRKSKVAETGVAVWFPAEPVSVLCGRGSWEGVRGYCVPRLYLRICLHPCQAARKFVPVVLISVISTVYLASMALLSLTGIP